MFKTGVAALCGLMVTLGSGSLYVDARAAATADERADEIVASFTIEDILGQMTQINIDSILHGDGTLNEGAAREFARARVGSYLNSPYAGGAKDNKYGYTVQEWRNLITRIQQITMEENGGHPMIYGIDSVHGAIYVKDATIFGQQLNAGASFNTTLVREMGEITGRDTAAAGIPWIFGPILEISQNPLWSRTYETFGEDPYLVSVMGSEIIKGIQAHGDVAACMKHFVGYSKTPTGHDRDGVTMSDFDLLNYFMPPFIEAVKVGVKTAMENYISINGEPVVASPKILRDLLRNDLGFEGFVVTDWAEIKNLHDFHRVARTQEEAVRLALTRTSIDMSMVPYETTFIDYAKKMLQEYPAYLERLRESARRIVKTKIELGLYEKPVPGSEYVGKVGQSADRQVALNLARESIVLLKNQGSILPLAKSAKIFLTGTAANDIGLLCGGWTTRWQGYSGNAMHPNGISVKKGFESLASSSSSISFLKGLNTDGSYSSADLETAKSMARSADYTVVTIGEDAYAEKPGDIDDLALPSGQIDYVRQLVSTGAKVIVVYVGGRPRLLSGLPDSVPAWINAMLPGELAGQAIAEIIYGDVNPSGRLPITYPKDPANIMIPYNHRTTTQCANGPCEMQWNFGTGLSYTSFSYSSLILSKTTVRGDSDSLAVSVTVRNTGQRAGKETVMLFVIQPFRSISVTEVKQLKKFTKINLVPGQSQTVTFTLTSADWSVFDPQIGNGFYRSAENGDFVVAIKPETDCDVYNSIRNPLCAKFMLQSSIVPFSLDEPKERVGISMSDES